MICYALGICFNCKDVKWYVPGNDYNANRFFAQRVLSKWQNNITQQCNTMAADACVMMEREHHQFYALKSKAGYCVIDCDTPLSGTQIRWLFYHLITKQTSMIDVANNLEAYTTDFKVNAIRQDLAELTVRIKEDLEKVFERGETIEKLVAKTEHLAMNSVAFRKITKLEEPCWSCTLM